MSGTIIVSAGNARRTLVKLVLTLAATIAVVCLLWPVARPALERVQVQPMWGIENMTGLTVLDVNIKIAGVSMEEK